jgi:hypothetical protein
MKTKLLLLLGLSLCYLGEQTAMGQSVPGSPPNADPDRLRAIVRAGAQKAGTAAVSRVWNVGARPRGPDDRPGRLDDHRAGHHGHALSHRRNRGDLHVHAPADAGRAGAHQPGPQDLALVSPPPGRRSGNGANAGRQHGRLHRLCDGGRLPEAGTGRAVSHLYGRGVDQLLGPRRQDELPTRHKPAILPHGQCHPGSGHSARHEAVHEGAVRQEYLWTDGA